MSIFSQIPIKPPKRSRFNLSHDVKLSGDFGVLYPILCQEVVPGDKFKIDSAILCKMAPMLAPVMHRVNARIHYFFVPNRLIWDNWETFITGGETGTESPDVPYATFANDSDSVGVGSLSDYLGLPVGAAYHSMPFSILPHRAYHLIWNEYFRDQNLQNEYDFGHGDGMDFGKTGNKANTWSTFDQLHSVCWRKDYFTSALPSPQRGPEVTLSGIGTAPIKGQFVSAFTTNELFSYTDIIGYSQWNEGAAAKSIIRSSNDVKLSSGQLIPAGSLFELSTDVALGDDGSKKILRPLSSYYASGRPHLSADLSGTGFSIEKLRNAARLQEYYELFARAGGRYMESLRAFFGVSPRDSRLQRPEFLGGGIIPLQIGEVLQTSSSDQTSPQANMAGHGMAFGQTAHAKKYIEEHGFIMGLLSIIPDATYQDGMPRMYSRHTRYDYYWPQFAHLGEQAIKNKEIYIGSTDPNGTFGYTPRYAEYKYQPSRVCGEMRKQLNYWHLGRIFGTYYNKDDNSEPILNSDFVTVQSAPLNRIFSVTETDTNHFYLDVYHTIKAARPMPRFGVPRL